MATIQTEVLVIGGGATGTGVLRDLAMRGFKAVLVDKSDLTQGTTGRYHGLLHSGARYCVKDPQAAQECIEENRILRHIMPQCIEDTGGFFVITPWDDPGYAERFVQGCQAAGIPMEEISIAEMLRLEPLLNPKITRCFRVPDASADSFLGAHLNVESARQYGAQVFTYHRVENLILSGSDPRRVVGAQCRNLVTDEPVTIHADLVVNASGAWAGQIAALAGLTVQIIPGKGTLLAMNHRIVNTVINRCRMPSDGDILVPAHTVSVIGTTDVKVSDPDHFAIEPWEVNLCLEEGDKLVPGFKHMRMLRAWAGVRPLYQEGGAKESAWAQDDRAITRAFVLLDHEVRDGVPGLITITSGKWTTYRRMAEVTVNLVCTKLGTQRPCRTHLEPLPDLHDGHRYYYLGKHLHEIEDEAQYGNLVCECELVTRAAVENAILHDQVHTIDDLRRDVRLGMGPCQGGFCTYRAAGILHELTATGKITSDDTPRILDTNAALRDFLQERWKGLLPVLWGQQLRQERLDELIYLYILNADHLPGPRHTPLVAHNYLAPDLTDRRNQALTRPLSAEEAPRRTGQQRSAKLDVLVIGAGLAGLTVAWQAAATGLKTCLISKGWGSDHWLPGCIDVLGYYPLDCEQPLDSPLQGIKRLLEEHPRHPYALVGVENLHHALEAFKQLCAKAGYPLHGSLEKNWRLPSALGAVRPTCLAPETMIAGDMSNSEPTLVVGFRGFADFYPHLIASNLNAQGIPAEGIFLELESLQARRFIYSRTLAELFETPEFRAEIVSHLKAHLPGVSRVGFPAVLGLDNARQIHQELQDSLGIPIFEIPTLPPSIPGIRLHRILVNAIQSEHGRVYEGMQVVEAERLEDQIVSVWSEAAARKQPHTARQFVLATGGILGGGIQTFYPGHAREMVFELPVPLPTERSAWFESDFLCPNGHPIFRAGISVDEHFRPINSGGKALYSNVFVAGLNLSGWEAIRERSLEGVALASGYRIGQILGASS